MQTLVDFFWPLRRYVLAVGVAFSAFWVPVVVFLLFEPLITPWSLVHFALTMTCVGMFFVIVAIAVYIGAAADD